MQWVKTLWAWINILYDLYIGKYCAGVYGIWKSYGMGRELAQEVTADPDEKEMLNSVRTLIGFLTETCH